MPVLLSVQLDSTWERSTLTLLQEELDLKPGQSFLDVGSGCGIVTACAAYLVSHATNTTR